MTNKTQLTRDELIDQIKAIPEPHTRKNVREFIPDSQFLPVFGSFTAFRECAGLGTTRYEKQFNSCIASNATNYDLNKLNDKKAEYEGKYQRPSNKRFQTILVASDFHSTLCDEFSLSCFIDTAARVQPEVIVLAGDVLDFECLNTHQRVDPRRFTISQELKWLDSFLTNVRNVCPNSQLTYIIGNHTVRLLRHLSNESPYVKELLADYHGFNFAKLLGLDKFEVNFVSKDDLTVYKESAIQKEIRKNHIVLHDCLAIGHDTSIKKLKMNSIHGHLHQYCMQQDYSYSNGVFHHLQLGAMTKRDATYCDSSHWQNGFTLAHIDTYNKNVQFEYIDCTHGFAIIGGKFLERT